MLWSITTNMWQHILKKKSVLTTELAFFRLSLKHWMFLRNRDETDVSVVLRRNFKKWSCLPADKMILALRSVTQTRLWEWLSMHAEFQACGSQEYRGFCMELNEPSTVWKPSLGNKYQVAMVILKVVEGWINQNTVNLFYELPTKSSVTWTLWSVSSYSSFHHTENPPWMCNDTHLLYWVLHVYSWMTSSFAWKAFSYKQKAFSNIYFLKLCITLTFKEKILSNSLFNKKKRGWLDMASENCDY